MKEYEKFDEGWQALEVDLMLQLINSLKLATEKFEQAVQEWSKAEGIVERAGWAVQVKEAVSRIASIVTCAQVFLQSHEGRRESK